MLYSKETDGFCTFSTSSVGAVHAYESWEDIYENYSVAFLLRSKFTNSFLDYVDPHFRDLLEEISDYHGGEEVIEDGIQSQMEDFNWAIEGALRQHPYDFTPPTEIPKIISEISINPLERTLIWRVGDEMSGEISLTERQNTRLSQRSTLWKRNAKKWEPANT